jgi:hypothetical protein
MKPFIYALSLALCLNALTAQADSNLQQPTQSRETAMTQTTDEKYFEAVLQLVFNHDVDPNKLFPALGRMTVKNVNSSSVSYFFDTKNPSFVQGVVEYMLRSETKHPTKPKSFLETYYLGRAGMAVRPNSYFSRIKSDFFRSRFHNEPDRDKRVDREGNIIGWGYDVRVNMPEFKYSGYILFSSTGDINDPDSRIKSISFHRYEYRYE